MQLMQLMQLMQFYWYYIFVIPGLPWSNIHVFKNAVIFLIWTHFLCHFSEFLFSSKTSKENPVITFSFVLFVQVFFFMIQDKKIFWASFLILAVLSFSWVQQNLIVLSVVGLNLISWMCLKLSLNEVGSIILTLDRWEEKILQTCDSVILPECL